MNNNQVERKDSDGKKIFTMLILIFSLMVCTTGATYAFYALSASNASTVTGTAGTASLSLTVSKIKPTATGSGKLVPQYSYFSNVNTLKKAVDASCIDTNNNLVCQVYTIVLTNNSTSDVEVNGTFTLTASTMSNLKWYTLTSGSGATPGTNYTYPTTTAAYGNLKSVTSLASAQDINAGASYYYVVVVWIEETGSDQSNTDKGSFTGTVAFSSSIGGGVTSTIRS